MIRGGEIRTRVLSLLFLMGSLAGLGCDPTGVTTKRFVVRVDSISAPDSITPTEALTVRFWGNLGPDLCSRLDRVDKHRFAGGIELRFHGVRATGGGDCLQMPAALQHDEMVAPPLENPFTIRVLQPDGVPPLERQVRVR